MAVILGLLIVCLGIYFLTLFFQVARLEKELTEGVTLLERYMIVTYSLAEDKKEGEGDDKDKEKDKEKSAAAPGKDAKA